MELLWEGAADRIGGCPMTLPVTLKPACKP